MFTNTLPPFKPKINVKVSVLKLPQNYSREKITDLGIMGEKDKPLYCRLCLLNLTLTKKCFKKLFSLLNPVDVYLDIIESVGNFRIMKDDSYSKLVCMDCWDFLNSIVKFKDIIQRSDLKLKSLNPGKRPTKTYGNSKLNRANQTDVTTIKNETFTNDWENNNFKVETDVDNKIDIKECNLEAEIKQESIEAEECSKVDSELAEEVCEKSKEQNSSLKDIGTSENDERMNSEILQESSSDSEEPDDREEAGNEKTDIGKSNLPNINKELTADKQESEVHKLVEKNKDKKPFPCRLCKKSYQYYRTYLLHSTKHTGISPLICSICNKSFKRSADLLDHEHEHIRRRCRVCHKLFKNTKLVKKHEATHIEPYKCSKCDKVYYTMKFYQRHLNSHVNNQDEIKCQKCNEIFQVRKDYWTHLQRDHPPDPALCDICGRTFKTKKTLISHKSVHFGKQFKCRVCDKDFHWKHKLQSHMQINHFRFDNLLPHSNLK